MLVETGVIDPEPGLLSLRPSRTSTTESGDRPDAAATWKKRLRNGASAPVPYASWFAAHSCQDGRSSPRPPGRFGTRTCDLKQSNVPPGTFEAAEEFREGPTRHS